MTPREVAYLALLASLRHQDFIIDVLENWQKKEHPSALDFSFAYEIASGSSRMAITLDYIAEKLSSRQKLDLKLKEKALLRTAIYQYCFMTKVPLYAIINESVNLAKKYCYRTFVSYVNAALRQLETGVPPLPTGNSPEAISLRYSYPLSFVSELIADYGNDCAVKVLSCENQPPKTMVRLRSEGGLNNLRKLKDIPAAILDEASLISDISSSSSYYIQNATPVALAFDLASKTPYPKRILDLCASPGGKLLAAHDIFPEASLYANDVSEDKLTRLNENLRKYGVFAHLSCGKGEEYQADEPFDLIILDVPCSNSGVLNKRPEARWRLTAEALEELRRKQLNLIARAVQLLSPDGSIWYLTCSILKKENERMIEEVCEALPLRVSYTRTILPNEEGWDGGFAALLRG